MRWKVLHPPPYSPDLTTPSFGSDMKVAAAQHQFARQWDAHFIAHEDSFFAQNNPLTGSI
jgi:hypothetical protein